ncbi:MAG TPA: hybrid sensor histidine kinase/response regulator, partial [Cytophagales bacterium]|nr:hybrid sensor histidine kinase/response regulator [Cytophagales bacterium]
WRAYRQRLIRRQQIEFDRREAARLKELDDIKTRFFSNITHEFRTPLTLILSPLEKRLRDGDVPADVRELLQNNHRHGHHLLKLVNQLLDISKLESNKMLTHESAGDLGLFLADCFAQFQPLAQERKIDFTLTQELAGQFLFDKAHLEKIVFNLLSNALKFTPSQGQVNLSARLVSTSSAASVLQVQVQDTGQGIPEEEQSKLFDRFYQVDSSETRVEGGTGIGLSLVKELTELLQGDLQVESQVGVGSTFTVRLPVTPLTTEEPNDQPIEVLRSTPPAAESRLILVVEDNEELRSFLVESLSEEWTVLAAPNGKRALEVIEQELPDIVISDVMMPEMDGYQLCQHIKQDIRTAHISFIMLTAKAAQDSKEKGLEFGADDYLTKPFNVYELNLRIHNQIQHQENLSAHLKAHLFPVRPQEEPAEVENEFVLQLNEYLADNFDKPDLKVDTVAQEMSMSKSTLNRKLKALLSTSANDFIKNYRLQRALEFLTKGRSVSETAFAVGFESHSYFSQCFKEQYGTTPSEFLKTGV